MRGCDHPLQLGVELLQYLNETEELCTEVQGMITSPHLATTVIYDVSRLCSLYLNRCVTASSSEDVGAPGSTVPFLLEPILLELEGGRYVGPLFPLPLAELVSRRRGGNGCNCGSVGTGDGGSSGGNGKGGEVN